MWLKPKARSTARFKQLEKRLDDWKEACEAAKLSAARAEGASLIAALERARDGKQFDEVERRTIEETLRHQ